MIRLITGVTLALLVTQVHLHAQQWQLMPSAGYDVQSKSPLLGLRVVGPLNERRWFGDRQVYEGSIGVDGDYESALFYLDSQHLILGTLSSPHVLVGIGLGGSLRRAPAQNAVLAGLSSSIVSTLNEGVEGSLTVRWLAATTDPSSTVQILLGLTSDQLFGF